MKERMECRDKEANMKERMECRDKAYRGAVKSALEQTVIDRQTLVKKMGSILEIIEAHKNEIKKHVEDSEDRIARFVEEMKIEIMMRDERKDQEIRDEIDELKENLSETRDHFNP